MSELKMDEVIEGLGDGARRRGVERGSRLIGLGSHSGVGSHPNFPAFRILAPFFCPLPACLGHQTCFLKARVHAELH